MLNCIFKSEETYLLHTQVRNSQLYNSNTVVFYIQFANRALRSSHGIVPHPRPTLHPGHCHLHKEETEPPKQGQQKAMWVH